MIRYAEIYHKEDLIVKLNLDSANKLMIYTYNDRILPVKIKWLKYNTGSKEEFEKYSIEYLQEFFVERIVQYTRQDLNEIKKYLGIDDYSAYNVIDKNYGLCTDDYFWVKLDPNRFVTYANIKIRE